MAENRIKIMLDAGHFDFYNHSPANADYWESLVMWELHLLLKAELEAYGFIVGVTRTDQKKDLDLYYRGAKAKGYNVFLSLHSNAVGSYRSDAIDYAIVYMLHDDTEGEKLADSLTTEIARTMKLNQGGRIGTRLQPNGTEYYGVLRGAKAVGCPHAFIVEHSFHTAYAPATWLLNRANLQKLAVTEAACIAKYYGYTKEDEQPMTKDEKAYVEKLEKRIATLEKQNKVYHLWDEIKALGGDMHDALYAMYKAGFFKGSSDADLNISKTKLEALVVQARAFKAAGILKY